MKSAYFLFIYFFIALSPTYSQPDAINKITGWVNNNCIPLKSVIAETGLQDLQPLDTVIGNARIVALGECTHGSSEIFSTKHRMLEYLVKEKGFTIFSIEANMPEAYALNKYILQSEGDPKKLIAGMYFWTWNTQEVLDMIEWMKKYNNTALSKISFTGFDMQIPFTSIKIVRNYLTVHSIPVNEINDFDSRYLENSRKHGYKNYKSREIILLAEHILETLQQDGFKAKDSSYIWPSKIQNYYVNMQL